MRLVQIVQSLLTSAFVVNSDSNNKACFVDASVTAMYISRPLFSYNILFPSVKRGYLTLVVLILLPA